MSKQIITWDWRTDPEAPRTWKHPENLVVLVDGLYGLAGAEGHPSEAIEALAKSASTSILVEDSAVWARAYTDGEWDARAIPAVLIERQNDLAVARLAPMMRLLAPHRALVIAPREAIDLDLPTCPICGSQDPAYNEEPDGTLSDGTPYCREHGDELEYGHVLDPCAGANGHGVDLVIVRAPIGPDAWPMHPAWVRAIRDQCKEAGVAFCFAGWGEWLPISEAMPGDEQRASATAYVWRGRERDPDGLPLLSYRVGADHPAMRTLDGVDHLELPEDL